MGAGGCRGVWGVCAGVQGGAGVRGCGGAEGSGWCRGAGVAGVVRLG